MTTPAIVNPEIETYIVKHCVRETAVQRELREHTASYSNSRMQISPDQAQFMQLLARTVGARRYLEIGVFTGYSALAIALAMPDDGRIVACDVSKEYTDVARQYWDRAGVAGKIDLRLGPALDTLDGLLSTGGDPFDLAFIDADKSNVDNYYERALKLVRTGGLVLIDNVLWDGAVLDDASTDADTAALRAIATKVGGDERVDCSLVPLRDGILIARKR